jgi:hypothetical protein
MNDTGYRIAAYGDFRACPNSEQPAPYPPRVRAVCAGCGRTVLVRKDGRWSSHDPHRTPFVTAWPARFTLEWEIESYCQQHRIQVADLPAAERAEIEAWYEQDRARRRQEQKTAARTAAYRRNPVWS